MFPILFKYENYWLSSWHVFFVLGAIISWFYFCSKVKKIYPEIQGQIDYFFIVAYLCSYIGARTLSIFLEREYMNLDFNFYKSITSVGSMTLYGGALSCALVVILWTRKNRLDFLRFSDLVITAGLLAIGIGRIGCFLNGDDFGKVVSDQMNLRWYAVRFPNLDDGLFRYPTQIFESFLCFFLFFFGRAFQKKFPLKVGIASDIGVIGYAVGRFGIEFLRDDFRGVMMGGMMSPAQIISILILIFWVVYRARGFKFRRFSQV